LISRAQLAIDPNLAERPVAASRSIGAGYGHPTDMEAQGKLMSTQPDILTRLSDALAARSAAASRMTAAIRPADGTQRGRAFLSGLLWQSNVVVTSEQALPKRGEWEIVAADENIVRAGAVARDSSTNIAVLRLEQALPFAPFATASARAGALALAFGADSSGGIRTRLGVVNAVGPEWRSLAGGRIERRVWLDVRLGRTEEGGPVLDEKGALLGMSTFGPWRRVLAIPSATLERVLPQLLRDGYIARGWLGLALQPVAVPDSLRETAGQPIAVMVMQTVDGGPAAQAGVAPGDLLLTVDGTPVAPPRGLATALDAESIGREVELRLIRAGAVFSVRTTVAQRPRDAS
jgi:S1-C subfamily serine protease